MKTKTIIAHIESLVGVVGSPVKVVDCVAAYYRLEEELPELAAIERAEGEAKRLLSHLAAHIERTEADARQPILRVYDEDSATICGSCWSTANAPEEQIVRNNAFSCVPDIVISIRALSAARFESFCAAFLHTLGAHRTKVTPRSGDHGIDFYGWLNLGGILSGDASLIRLSDHIRFFFAGQAKHYPHARVGPSVVRELVGAVSLARHSISSSSQEFFEGMDFKALDPLVVLLLTTGGFTKGAKELAIGSGIFPFDVGQIATYLAGKMVGLEARGTHVLFVETAFHDWIDGYHDFDRTAPLD